MSIERETVKNSQYIYKYKGNSFSNVITYKKHLINKIKGDPNTKENKEVQKFSAESVTDEKFATFVRIASDAGYTIYKVERL